MLRTAMRTGPLCAMIYPLNVIFDNPDKPLHTPTQRVENVPDLMPGEIAVYRLKKIFELQDGMLSKELQSIIGTTFSGMAVGFFMGGILGAQNVPENFKAENTATSFRNEFEARRQLQNKFTLAFGKGGFKFGVRLAFFCFIYGTSSTCLNVYRGKVEVANYMAAGALTGALFKMSLGLKGIVSGATVGTTLGGLYGAVAVLILYLTGVEMNSIYATQDKWFSTRKKIARQQMAEHSEDDMPHVKQLHEINQQTKEQESQGDVIPTI